MHLCGTRLGMDLFFGVLVCIGVTFVFCNSKVGLKALYLVFFSAFLSCLLDTFFCLVLLPLCPLLLSHSLYIPRDGFPARVHRRSRAA